MPDFASDFIESFNPAYQRGTEQGIDIYNKTKSFRLMQAQFEHQKTMDKQTAAIQAAEDARRQAEFDRKTKELEARETAIQGVLESSKPTGADVTKAVKRGEKVGGKPYDFLIKKYKTEKALATAYPEEYLKRKLPPTPKEQLEMENIRSGIKHRDQLSKESEERVRKSRAGGDDRVSDKMKLIKAYVELSNKSESEMTPEEKIYYNDVLKPIFAKPELTLSDMLDVIFYEKDFTYNDKEWKKLKIKDAEGNTLKGAEAKEAWKIQTGIKYFGQKFIDLYLGNQSSISTQETPTQSTSPLNELPSGWLNAQP